jgi:hypothetical protein
MRLIAPTMIAAIALVAALPARAEMATYKAMLNAASEVPPNTSTATGEITATFDSATKKLSWQGSYKGLTSPETAAHFHGPAAAGTNAGVAVPVDAKASPFSGSAMLTDPQAADLMAGKWYFNVHTDRNKGGEIRGQLAK